MNANMIAVISDSHVPYRADEIPGKFLEKVEEAELVVHCGDFETQEVHEMIERLADDLVAVKGNCDRLQLEVSQVFEREDVSYGVYHGSGITPRGHHPTLVETARKLDVDVLLHGHTHEQEAVEVDGKVLLNPGSCTGVGGGTATESAPSMMVVEPGEKLAVRLLRLVDGEVESEYREFDV